MKKYVFLILEAAAILVVIGLAIRWGLDPEGNYEPFIALFGSTFFILEFLRRYMPNFMSPNSDLKHASLHFSLENTFLARFVSEQNSKSGNLCIGFYSLTISNDSIESFTLKEVIFRYVLDEEVHETDSLVVVTGLIQKSLHNEPTRGLLVHLSQRNSVIILMEWLNLRSEIAKLKTLRKGSVLSGSAIFILEIKDFNEVEKLKKTEIVVKDYSGNESVHPIDIEKEWITKHSEYTINPKEFIVDKDGNIKVKKNKV